MKNNVLSAFSFYGGKARMAEFICDLIDYDNTSVYIEPFGGACRVLLNKKFHDKEMYNDFGYGLTNFFETLSNPYYTDKIIEELLNYEPSEELFYKMKRYKKEQEGGLVDDILEELKVASYKCRDIDELFKKLHNLVCRNDLYTIFKKLDYNINPEKPNINILDMIICKYYKIKETDDRLDLFFVKASDLLNYWGFVNEYYIEKYEEFLNNANNSNTKLSKSKLNKMCNEYALEESIEEFTPDTEDSNGSEHDPLKMAVATFITYALSRDGMGTYYSSSKFKSVNDYCDYVVRLREVAERLRAVHFSQADAFDLVKKNICSSEVMMYLDPSYLPADDKNNSSNKKDLGKKVYNRSYSSDEHKKLAMLIRDAKAKIIISNYDIEEYNDVLTPEHGWKKIEFDTNTSVGSKSGNKRTEVLWMNY